MFYGKHINFNTKRVYKTFFRNEYFKKINQLSLFNNLIFLLYLTHF